MNDTEIIRAVAHLILRGHHDHTSPLLRVYGPWKYRVPDIKRNTPVPTEVWDRRALEPVRAGVSVYRERPNYWIDRDLWWDTHDPCGDDDPLFLPDGETVKRLGPIPDTRVFWVLWFNFRPLDQPGQKIERVPATSVEQAMRDSDAALREAGGLLAEEIVKGDTR